jgi:ABC-type phosphate transport system substrate-binding protein
MKKTFFLILLWFTLRSGGFATGAERFYIIVNNDNPVSSMDAKEVSKLFLKKANRWPNGQPVLPLDQSENSPIRETFSKEIHGKTIASLQAYWQQQIFSGRSIPPLVKNSDDEVIAYVKGNPNAISYVSSPPGAGVKVLKIGD